GHRDRQGVPGKPGHAMVIRQATGEERSMTDEPGEGDGTRIDIPLGFDVPDGWTPMDPATAGSPGVVFLAVRSAAAGSVFTPNITIVLDRRPEGVDLTEVADDSVERLSAVMDRLAVLDRKAVGDRTTPG